jgi:putative ABC transport system ATP-binding protein
MAPGEILIDVSGVAKHYGEGETRVDALRAIDLQVRAGEVIALLGPSGSGKTTLLNVIGCIIDPSAGRVVLDGETVFDGKWLRRDLRRLRLDKIGFIFQAHNLLPFLTAEENVAVVLHLAGWPPEKGRARARELLDYLEVGHRAPMKPAHLSGGEAQRVAIARALSCGSWRQNRRPAS